jgi:hypothetical protein
MSTKTATEKSIFVKFNWSSKTRRDASELVRDLVAKGACYHSAAYPRNKRPRRIRDGDVLYMAGMTMNPVGYAIFGRGEAKANCDGRDDWTPEEMEKNKWNSNYPHFIRLEKLQFIDGRLTDCIWLQSIIDELKEQAFASTARNRVKGAGNTDPKRALMRQPDVRLTEEGGHFLQVQFDQLLVSNGQIPATFIDNLPNLEIRCGE